MRELAPLLAEDCVDINDLTDIDALNQALQKAVERHNMELFTPAGARRAAVLAWSLTEGTEVGKLLPTVIR
jgi:hypothetical protein